MAARHRGAGSVARWVAAGGACVLVVALSGAGGHNPAIALSTAGHWVYNHSLGAVFHVDGAGGDADAKLRVPGLRPADQVTQDDTRGYIVDRNRSRVIIFGKADLLVRTSFSTGTRERPVIVEGPNGSTLVYRRAGRIVHFGGRTAAVAAGQPLDSPIVTSDGTLWVLEPRSGRVCRLAPGRHALVCLPGRLAAPGSRLVTVGDRPALVDPSAGTITRVSTGGLGRVVQVSIPAGAKVSGTDSGGRLAVISSDARRDTTTLTLIDVSTLDSGRPNAAPIAVTLPDGEYDDPATSGGAVVVVNRTARTVTSYDVRGVQRQSRSVPKDTARLVVTRGADGRVYVDDDGGTRTLVVDGAGDITTVDVGKNPSTAPPSADPADPRDGRTDRPGAPSSGAPSSGAPTGPTGPTVPSTSPTAPTTPVTPPSAGTPPPSAGTPDRRSPVGRDGGGGDAAAVAQRPDAPAGVTATARAASIRVDWSVPAGNGAPVTGYRVEWSTGSSNGRTTVTRTHATIRTDDPGARYTVRVAARNRVGWGPSSSAAPVVAHPAEPVPLTATASARADGSVAVSWNDEPGRWSFTVTAPGASTRTTTGARTTLTGLPLGRAVTVTVRGRERTTGDTVSGTTARVTPYRAASAPTGLAGVAAADGRQVVLRWSAPSTPGGGTITGYRVAVQGGPTSTVTGTVATVAADPDRPTVVRVSALTTDPNSGDRLVGTAASTTVRYAPPPPEVALDNGETRDGHLFLDFTLNTHGVTASCTVTRDSDGAVIWGPGALVGDRDDFDAGAIDLDDGDTMKIYLTCTTSGGTSRDPTVVNDG